MEPMVSCILPTYNRHHFLRQAILYYQRQNYRNKELIIVDDGEDGCEHLATRDPAIRYIRLDHRTDLGTKLNLGIEAACGEIMQKLDDDDYYHPNFLRTQIDTILQHNLEKGIVCYDRFLVYLAMTGKLKQTGDGWCAEGTLCFSKRLWKKIPFRPEFTCDWGFVKDHGGPECKVVGTELYVLVRHGFNSWNQMGNDKVNDYFSSLPDYPKSLSDLIGSEDASFYDSYRVNAGR